MLTNRILAILTCVLPLAAQTDAGLWRFVHPNAKALIGIDVARIRNSRVVAEMSAQLHSAPLPIGLQMFQLPGVVQGMDLLRSIDRVIVSSPGRLPAADGAETNEEPPIMIAVSGRFEPVKLAQMFLKSGARKQVFNGVTIYRPQDQSNSDFGFAVLNSQTMLIGDAKSLYSVIERVEKGATQLPSIVERARDMDVAYDFWAVLSTPPSAMASPRLPFAEFMENLKGFEAGIALREGLALDVNLNTASEQAAKDLNSQMSKLIHLGAKDHENHPEWAGLDRKLKIRVDHSDVHFSLRLDAMEVAKMAKSFDQARSRRRVLTAASAAAETEAPKSPLPLAPATAKSPSPNPAVETPVIKRAEPRQVIRIEGLDGGPREIPYHPNQ